MNDSAASVVDSVPKGGVYYVSPDGKKVSRCTCWWDDPCFSHQHVIKLDWTRKVKT